MLTSGAMTRLAAHARKGDVGRALPAGRASEPDDVTRQARRIVGGLRGDERFVGRRVP